MALENSLNGIVDDWKKQYNEWKLTLFFSLQTTFY